MPVFVHLKDCYILWCDKLYKFPKTSRYSLGKKIDSIFVELLEAVSLASFTVKDEKIEHVKRALSLTDTLKIFLQIAWETKILEAKLYTEISEELAVVGRMLGGWLGQLNKQNSSARAKENIV